MCLALALDNVYVSEHAQSICITTVMKYAVIKALMNSSRAGRYVVCVCVTHSNPVTCVASVSLSIALLLPREMEQ